MQGRTGFYEMLRRRWAEGRFVCVGLDPDEHRLPATLTGNPVGRIGEFCRLVVDATEQFAAAFKLNSAFFERLGVDGATVLEATIRYIKDRHPN